MTQHGSYSLGKLDTSPLAHKKAIVQGDKYRFQVLNEGILRIEWAQDGIFEDRASTLAIHRDTPVPDFQLLESDNVLEIITSRFHLTYDRKEFSPAGLTVVAKSSTVEWGNQWRYGDAESQHNLGGTARTLDEVDGRCPLEPGVLSKQGVTVLDDSESFLFEKSGWVGSRTTTSHSKKLDLYVFAFGRDYEAALKAFLELSGQQPLVPRWTFGNWWSRYYSYSADSYTELMERFDEEGVPFSVGVQDMGWHRDAPPEYGSNWTGYSWNYDLFPDPKAFLAKMRERGLRTTMNVHPADGVRAFEDPYEAMCKAMGQDPSTKLAVPFDCADERFMKAYFEVLHHPLEDQGVDFWWVDWQQGRFSRKPGVDPLWMLNHFHFLDSGRDNRRPLTFSRFAGPGSHRYPVGFSGDTVMSWASLRFQPEFTATASNIGYGLWSNDIGGHMFGARDDELATRWVQLGVYSPINRLHSSRNPFLVKEPWNYPAESRAAMVEALKFRHRLVPYLHTMNHLAANGGLPLMRPMYYIAPDEDLAYTVPNQYGFGTQLICAPIVTPRDKATLRSSVRAWLPAGAYVDIFTDTPYEGDQSIEMHRTLNQVPVLLKSGGILPLASDDESNATLNPKALEILIAPGADGEFTLIEDNETGSDVKTTPTAKTKITWKQSTGELRIAAVSGKSGIVPAERQWKITFIGVAKIGKVHVNGNDTKSAASSGRSSVSLPAHSTASDLVVKFDNAPKLGRANVSTSLWQLLNDAQYGNEEKLYIWHALQAEGKSTASKLAQLLAQKDKVPNSLISALSEIMTSIIAH